MIENESEKKVAKLESEMKVSKLELEIESEKKVAKLESESEKKVAKLESESEKKVAKLESEMKVSKLELESESEKKVAKLESEIKVSKLESDLKVVTLEGKLDLLEEKRAGLEAQLLASSGVLTSRGVLEQSLHRIHSELCHGEKKKFNATETCKQLEQLSRSTKGI